jgi:hypothetical protein
MLKASWCREDDVNDIFYAKVIPVSRSTLVTAQIAIVLLVALTTIFRIPCPSPQRSKPTHSLFGGISGMKFIGNSTFTLNSS